MRRFNRRQLFQVAGALGGVAALQGIASVAAQGMELSSLRSTSKSWLWAAEDFAQGTGGFGAGLKVVQAATERGVNQDALLSGAADVLLGATTQNMRVQIRNQPIVMICGMVNKFASNIVIRGDIAKKLGVTEATPVMDKAKALKGLKLGTTGPGAGPDQLLRYFFQQAGIDPDKDAQLVTVRGPAPMIAAFEQKQIDGFCLSSPTSDVAVSKFGAVYLFNMANNPPPALADYLYISASVTKKTAAEKGPALTAYCKGVALALKQIAADRDGFKAWAKTYFADLDPALFEDAFANNVNIYMKTPVPTEAQFKDNMDFLANELKTLGQPPMPANYKFADAFDLRFVEAAMKSL